MKRIISILLLLALCLSVFAGCNKDETENNKNNAKPSSSTEKVESDLPSAKAYLQNMYQTAGKDEVMVLPTDLDVLTVVAIGGVSYSVEWTVSITEGPSDSVKIGKSSKDNHVLLDINETPEVDVLFTATATIKDAAGKSDSVSFKYKVAASVTANLTAEEIIEMAYQLEQGASMEGNATLTAKIVKLKTPFDAQYGNITVVIAVPGLEDKPIECYRLVGDKVSNDLCVGDTITVTGILKNYNGTIEFDAGCTLDKLESCGIDKPIDSKLIVDAAFALAGGESLPYFCTLSGVVKSIESPYSDQYKNINLTIEVEGLSGKKALVCYRLKGVGADVVKVGDTITVTGVIKNYVKDDISTIEFDAGCTIDSLVPGEGGTTQNPPSDVPAEKPSTETGIVDAAYALEEGKSLPYKATLTGKITSIDDAYSADYGNITVTITVAGREKKPIKCYRLKGSGVDKIAKGDTITVTGTLKNYNGTIEFDFGCTLDKIVNQIGVPVKPETDPLKIIDIAYKLAENAKMEYDVTLKGEVVEIVDAYDSEHQNITVVIKVTGRESKPITCYRLKGDGVKDIAVKDIITVTGRLKNHYGTVEFDFGCKLDKRVSGGGDAVQQETDHKKLVDLAYGLAANTQLEYDATLTGKITKLKTPYDSEFKNMTVIIEVPGREGKPIECFRMKGDKVSNNLCVGDTITVKGRLKNYNGTIEFDAGCTLEKVTSGNVKKPTDPKKIVDAAFALAGGDSLKYFCTLTGKVIEINDEYSSQYKNITITIEVEGSDGVKELKCYRLKGTGAESIKVGDTVTVTGVIKNHVHSSGDTEIEFDAGCTLG